MVMRKRTWKVGTDLPIKLLLLVVIWLIMSISGVMIEPLRCEPAVELWEYVTDGQLAQELFNKRAESTWFPTNSYQTYINPGTNANLAASNPNAAAAVYRSTLYLSHNGHVYSLTAKKPTELTSITSADGLNSMIAGKGCLLQFDITAIRFLKSSGKFSHVIKEDGWLSEYRSADFGTVADRLFDLLNRQEHNKLTGAEISTLAYFTKEGTLLYYADKTAWLADSSTQPGIVTIYKQTAPGQREEAFHYQNNYAGLGSGRFAADDLIVYANGGPLAIYAMDGSFWITFEAEGVNAPTQALNYVRSSDGALWITYIDDDLEMHLINYKPGDGAFSHEIITIPESKGNGKIDGLFSVGTTACVFSTAPSGKTTINAYILK